MPVIIPAERRFAEPEIATARTPQKWGQSGQSPFFPSFFDREHAPTPAVFVRARALFRSNAMLSTARWSPRRRQPRGIATRLTSRPR